MIWKKEIYAIFEKLIYMVLKVLQFPFKLILYFTKMKIVRS